MYAIATGFEQWIFCATSLLELGHDYNNNSCILLAYNVVVIKMLKFGSYIYLNNAIFQPSQVLFFHIIEFLKQRSA